MTPLQIQIGSMIITVILYGLIFVFYVDVTVVSSRTFFGASPNSLPIWLDDVNCQGTELRLADCAARAIGTHNCNHNEDVGIRCSAPFSKPACMIVITVCHLI